MNMREKQILTSVIEIKKKKKMGVTTHFSKIIILIFVKSFKIQSNVWRSLPNWSLIISEKFMVTPNFRFGYQEHLLSSAFSSLF